MSGDIVCQALQVVKGEAEVANDANVYHFAKLVVICIIQGKVRLVRYKCPCVFILTCKLSLLNKASVAAGIATHF